MPEDRLAFLELADVEERLRRGDPGLVMLAMPHSYGGKLQIGEKEDLTSGTPAASSHDSCLGL